MQRKSDDYFVQIEQDFLFNSGKIYKSNYTVWIYLYLKLEYNIFIEKQNTKYVKLKADEIKDLFDIDKSTVYSCIEELGKDGLLTKNKRDNYKIYSEKHRQSRNGKSKFIKVFKNQFIELFDKGGSILDALTYYYMIQHNRHYAFERELLECDLTQTQLTRQLNKDSRYIKKAIDKLIRIGFVKKDENGKLYTKYFKRTEFKPQERKKKMEKIEIEPTGENLKEYIQYLIDSGTKLETAGWFKTKNGESEVRVLEVPGYGNVVNKLDYINSDNIPPSEEEWEHYLALVKNNSKNIMTVVDLEA